MPRSGLHGARKRAPQKNAAKPRPAVTAHAGSLRTRPNTPESFKAALAFPVDYLEADVRFTPKNEAYLSHDPLPMPLTRNVMRLKELLKLAASRPKVRLNLDMKEDSGIREMAALIKHSRMTSRVILTGISRDVISRVREHCDGLPYLLNTRPGFWHRVTATGTAAFVRTVQASGALGLNAHFLFVTRRLARALSAAGLSVSVWTVDGEPEMRRLLHLPVDNITTNRVDTLLALRNGRSR
jgi:glycerophosphoryl diester phosphodiesterase